jgi:hypothetical protein
VVQDEVATAIVALGISGITSANVFPRTFPAGAPDRAVAVHVYGGLPSDRVFGGALTIVNEYPLLHVFVRDDQDNEARASTTAKAIYDALDGLGPTTLSSVAYRDLRSLDGPPKFLGEDENHRPVYVLNFGATKDRS